MFILHINEAIAQLDCLFIVHCIYGQSTRDAALKVLHKDDMAHAPNVGVPFNGKVGYYGFVCTDGHFVGLQCKNMLIKICCIKRNTCANSHRKHRFDTQFLFHNRTCWMTQHALDNNWRNPHRHLTNVKDIFGTPRKKQGKTKKKDE